jgi:hypothetical protein
MMCHLLFSLTPGMLHQREPHICGEKEWCWRVVEVMRGHACVEKGPISNYLSSELSRLSIFAHHRPATFYRHSPVVGRSGRSRKLCENWRSNGKRKEALRMAAGSYWPLSENGMDEARMKHREIIVSRNRGGIFCKFLATDARWRKYYRMTLRCRGIERFKNSRQILLTLGIPVVWELLLFWCWFILLLQFCVSIYDVRNTLLGYTTCGNKI